MQTTDSARHLACRWTRCDVGTSVKPLQSGKPQVACCLLALLLPFLPTPHPGGFLPRLESPGNGSHRVSAQHRCFRPPVSARPSVAPGHSQAVVGGLLSAPSVFQMSSVRSGHRPRQRLVRCFDFPQRTSSWLHRLHCYPVLFHGYTNVYTVHGGLPSPSLEFCFPCHC